MNYEEEYLRLSDVEIKLEASKKELETRIKKVRLEMQVLKDCIIKEYLDDGVIPFGLSVKRLPPKAVIIDEDKIPEAFWRIKKELNKTEINKAMKDGLGVDGVMMDNGGYTVAIKAQNVKATEDQE